MTTGKIIASPAARARVAGKSKAELVGHITSTVRTIRQTGLPPSRPNRHVCNGKADVSEPSRTLDDVREAWRRLEAQGDPLGLRHGRKQEQARSLSEPTDERRAKASGIGYRKVGSREVRKLLTTADLLEQRDHLPKHLRGALDKFCVAVAEAMNVNVGEDQPATARQVSGYDGTPLNAYGPRDMSDRALDARHLWKSIERQVPDEMRDVLEQLVGEETGLLQGRPESLQKYGRVFGWEQDKQAGAAGSMLAISACAVLHHAIKRGVGQNEKPAGARNTECTETASVSRKRK